jgi:hypothetical protein
MSTIHEGGCLCRAVRYETTGAPRQTTVCHCTFCQKLTGSAFLVESIFRRDRVVVSDTAPTTYEHRSDGSDKRVTVCFCATCGTTVCLAFERFADFLGICAGTFDDRNWFERSADNCSHIFTRSAQRGVVLPAGLAIFTEHALRLDGTLNDATILAEPRLMTSPEALRTQ